MGRMWNQAVWGVPRRQAGGVARPARKGLAAYLDVHLVVSRPVDGPVEPEAHHKDALADREPAGGTQWQTAVSPA